MRFILMVRATEYSEAGVHRSKLSREALLAYRQRLAEAEVLVAAEQVQPSGSGLRITRSPNGAAPSLQAGPFPAEQALIVEYFLIDVDSEQEALHWALRLPLPENGSEMSVELRRIEDIGFTDEFSPRPDNLEADLHNQLTILRDRDEIKHH